MHLITGFIVASLFGKKKDAGKSLLLRLQYPIKTNHLLPGRVRFQIDALKKNIKGEQFLNEQLPKIKGIKSIQINTITGSVLIHFSEEDIQPELLFTALIRLLGLEKELEKTPQSFISREIRLIGKSLNRAVLERTGGIIDLSTAIPIVLGVMGIQKIMCQQFNIFRSTLMGWRMT